MKKQIIVLIVLILFVSGSIVAGPVEVKRISADANWFVRIDCERFFKSSLGDILKTHLAEESNAQKLGDFEKVFGFNPIEDIRSVMTYGQGDDREKGIVLIEGEFDKEKLVALIGAKPEYKKLEYSGLEIHKWLQEHKNPMGQTERQITYGCSYGDDLIILGSGLPAFKQAIDVLKGSAPGADSDVFNDDLLDNAFFQVAAKDVAKSVGDKPRAALLRQTDRLVIAVSEVGDNILSAVNLTAKSEETAGYIKKMIEGIIANIALDSGKDPIAAKLAQKIQISGSGSEIQIRLEQDSLLAGHIISSRIANTEN